MKNNAGNNSFIAEMEKVRASHNFQINTETKINLESDFFIGNLDYDVEVEKSDEIEIILEYSLRRLKTLICNENYNEAYDLTDAIHALPEIYAEGRTDNLSNYWKIFIEPIREKWGYDYFNECEKLFV
ncbi:MAG: hypothetical protein LBL58_17085 [Tannerellaceae bacterium]|nr:hypothetical protein [Tannerellaceae bacterium]